MKILWFANTPCGAAEKLNLKLNIGGWLTSLEEQVVQIENLELSVSFYWGEKLDPFTFKRTTYYPALRTGSSSKTGRLINRAFQRDDDSKEVQQILKIINTVKPDVIHVHGTEDNFGLIQDYTNIPVVVSIQGILSVYLEKFFSGIPLAPAFLHERFLPKLLFKSVRFTYNNLKRSALRERRIYSQTKYIIGRTEWDRKISHLFAPWSRYYEGNEILRNSFYDRIWNKKKFNNPIQLVTVMSGGLYKGLETIAKTAVILCKEKNLHFNWIIIGQNESDDMIKIVKRWLKVDFGTLNINFVGAKSEMQVADILLESDIFCQVSHIENSSNSVCEAMLLGIPIIATFAGGTDSILENRKEGVLIQDGDAYSLAATIIDISRNFQKAVEYGLDAHIRSTSRHNKCNIACKLVDTYKDILHLEKTNK